MQNVWQPILSFSSLKNHRKCVSYQLSLEFYIYSIHTGQNNKLNVNSCMKAYLSFELFFSFLKNLDIIYIKAIIHKVHKCILSV